jgi:hypothetical protein
LWSTFCDGFLRQIARTIAEQRASLGRRIGGESVQADFETVRLGIVGFDVTESVRELRKTKLVIAASEKLVGAAHPTDKGTLVLICENDRMNENGERQKHFGFL